MRSVNSAFWLALQRTDIVIAELVDLETIAETYRWTTSNVPLRVGSTTYTPFPGAAGEGAEESTDLGIGTISFTMVNSSNLRQQIAAYGLDNAPVTVSRVLVNSPGLGRLYVFRGRLGDLSYDRLVINGQARNIFNGVTGRFPNHTYQDTCVWRFGSSGCGVTVASYTVAGSLNVASSHPLILTVASGVLGAYSAGHFDRGRVTMLTGANSGQVRTIRAHSGDVLFLSHTLPFGVGSADTFSLYPGCRKRLDEDCVAKYDNGPNHLGFKWIPKAESAF
jgi:uncharacterized phage protein (TIGR02218 family)